MTISEEDAVKKVLERLSEGFSEEEMMKEPEDRKPIDFDAMVRDCMTIIEDIE